MAALGLPDGFTAWTGWICRPTSPSTGRGAEPGWRPCWSGSGSGRGQAARSGRRSAARRLVDPRSGRVEAFVLYERVEGGRQSGSHPRRQPWSSHSTSTRKAKLILGSTAKLRTPRDLPSGSSMRCIRSFRRVPPRSCGWIASMTDDPLRRVGRPARWAAHRARASRVAAVAGRRDATPLFGRSVRGVFHGGGGVARVSQLRALGGPRGGRRSNRPFEHSINLAFVRLLRDVIRHYRGGHRRAGRRSWTSARKAPPANGTVVAFSPTGKAASI